MWRATDIKSNSDWKSFCGTTIFTIWITNSSKPGVVLSCLKYTKKKPKEHLKQSLVVQLKQLWIQEKDGFLNIIFVNLFPVFISHVLKG